MSAPHPHLRLRLPNDEVDSGGGRSATTGDEDRSITTSLIEPFGIVDGEQGRKRKLIDEGSEQGSKKPKHEVEAQSREQIMASATPSSPVPFSWDTLPSSPSLPPTSSPDSAPSPPTSWLPAKDMKTFGAETLRTEVGIVKCEQCCKPLLKSAVLEHAENCRIIRSGAWKVAVEEKGRIRKAGELEEKPSEQKNKLGTKRRLTSLLDYDKHCGVINLKGVPCQRSLTCRIHTMTAKRAVQGRSKGYNELLLDWGRKHNPNIVEPVKRKKVKRVREIAAVELNSGLAGLKVVNSFGSGGGGSLGDAGTVTEFTVEGRRLTKEHVINATVSAYTPAKLLK